MIHLFGEVPLVLSLQFQPPLHGVFELRTGSYKQFDGLCVAQAHKVVFEHILEPLQQAFVDELVKELHLGGAAVEHGLDDVLDHRLGDVHIPREVAERHLRLDHPELRRVARGKAVLRAERRAEGVDIPESHGERFAVELAGNGQVGRLAEEVAAKIDLAVFILWHIVQRQGRYLEHLPRAFAVRTRDQRRVDVDEPALLEELVNSRGHNGAHAERRLKGVCPRAEMLNGAQVFERMALFLQRVIAGASAFEHDFVCVDFERLRRVRRNHELAFDRNCAAGRQPVAKISIVALEHDLDGRKAAPVGQFDKAEGFPLAHGAHPAAYADLARVRFRRFLNL
ncbi:hypothetical protein SDC9_56496 [bioreactor metagenome]|uniref:Uncharacterized protein n=1 Tax=bioreactor metagenome TaxID=1076179 RepID=A0A644X2R1_9ZZZZ